LNERPKAAFSRNDQSTSTFKGTKAEVYSSSDSSPEEEDSEDSDCSESNSKRFRGRRAGIPVPSAKAESSASKEELNAFNAHAASFQETRKVNNIWCDVLHEQEFTENFNKVNVMGENLKEVDRGPESFFVESRKRARPEPLEYESSSVSSAGLSDDTLDYLNGDGSKMKIKINSDVSLSVMKIFRNSVFYY